jgi:hypothetical protein
VNLVVVGIDSGQPVAQLAVVESYSVGGQRCNVDRKCIQGAGNEAAGAERAVAAASFDDAWLTRPRIHVAEDLAMQLAHIQIPVRAAQLHPEYPGGGGHELQLRQHSGIANAESRCTGESAPVGVHQVENVDVDAR